MQGQKQGSQQWNLPPKQKLPLYAKISLWLLFLYLSTFVNLHTLYIIVSALVLIFSNLGARKPGQLSAYSVFNKDFKKPAGSMDAQAMVNFRPSSMRDQVIFGKEEQEQARKIDEYFKNESKYGNKPCYCQSGLKFKKCCYLRKRLQKQNTRKQL